VTDLPARLTDVGPGTDEDEWVECTACQGDRGRMDHEVDEWVDCAKCQGEGGWRP
jgi:hypothetical protein